MASPEARGPVLRSSSGGLPRVSPTGTLPPSDTNLVPQQSPDLGQQTAVDLSSSVVSSAPVVVSGTTAPSVSSSASVTPEEAAIEKDVARWKSLVISVEKRGVVRQKTTVSPLSLVL